MGQQQLLLILLGVILVGAAIVLALSLIGAQSVQHNRAAIINDLNHLAAHASQYRFSSAARAGGAGKYSGYAIPIKLAKNANASYSCTLTDDQVTFTAVSAADSANTITVAIDPKGKFIATSWSYTGDFQ